MAGLSVVERLAFDLYGLKVEMGFARRGDAGEVARLLKLFLGREAREPDLRLNYLKRERAQEVGTFLFPALAKRRIWAMHAGGIHFRGGLLVVGPSGRGKSTFSYMALKAGFPIVSDDITLLRASQEGVQLLPFFSTIYPGDVEIEPDPGAFRPAILRAILFPRMKDGPWEVRPMGKRGEVVKRLVTNLLWARDGSVRKDQKEFLEALSGYPAFEVNWPSAMFEDSSIFRRILYETLQS